VHALRRFSDVSIDDRPHPCGNSLNAGLLDGPRVVADEAAVERTAGAVLNSAGATTLRSSAAVLPAGAAVVVAAARAGPVRFSCSTTPSVGRSHDVYRGERTLRNVCMLCACQ
jgi:hypothetical protein